jgi:PucR C-terminal helix-turn-helix domain
MPSTLSLVHEDSGDLRELVDRVDLDELVRRFTLMARAEIAFFARLDSTALRALQPTIASTIRMAVRYIIHDAPAVSAQRAQVLEDLLAVPRRLARSGLGLDDLLRAYHLGARLGIEAVGKAAKGDESGLLALAGARIMSAATQVSTAAVQMYLANLPDLSVGEEARADELLRALLDGEPMTAELRSLATALGLTVDGAVVPFAVRGAGAEPPDCRGEARALRAAGVLAVAWGEMAVGLAPVALADVVLSRASRALVVLGDRMPAASPRTQLRTCEAAAALAYQGGRSTGRVTISDYLGELLLLDSPDLAAAVHQEIVEPVRKVPGLLDTLGAYIAHDLDVVRTCAALHVHRNTLYQRLRRITALTGRTFERSNDLLLFLLATRVTLAGKRT